MLTCRPSGSTLTEALMLSSWWISGNVFPAITSLAIREAISKSYNNLVSSIPHTVVQTLVAPDSPDKKSAKRFRNIDSPGPPTSRSETRTTYLSSIVASTQRFRKYRQRRTAHARQRLLDCRHSRKTDIEYLEFATFELGTKDSSNHTYETG